MSAKSRPVTHDNHYVPQALLRRWSVDGFTLFARRLLVSHPAVPEWERTPIRGLARQRDLYTSLLSGEEADEFEQWIATDFEKPASDAIDKVVSGTRLKREDWHSLARFVALQDLRTPASFFAQMERWEKEMPALLQNTMKSAIQQFEQARTEGRALERQVGGNDFSGLFHVSVERPEEPNGQALLRTDVTLGRGLWLASMRGLLNEGARVLTEHQWSIAEPADAGEWPLTDHPVLKLNYSGPTKYDFGGGWGRRNVDLMMPISPRHLLFVQVGKDSGRKLTLTSEQTDQLRRFHTERAHRWVFATEPLDWVVRMRPRVVDAAAFDRESAMWARWHQDQLQAELPTRESARHATSRHSTE
jgi:Protein of unknown function (DUF4238)